MLGKSENSTGTSPEEGWARLLRDVAKQPLTLIALPPRQYNGGNYITSSDRWQCKLFYPVHMPLTAVYRRPQKYYYSPHVGHQDSKSDVRGICHSIGSLSSSALAIRMSISMAFFSKVTLKVPVHSQGILKGLLGPEPRLVFSSCRFQESGPVCALATPSISSSVTVSNQCEYHRTSRPIMTLGRPEKNAAAPLSGKAHSTSQAACDNHFAVAQLCTSFGR